MTIPDLTFLKNSNHDTEGLATKIQRVTWTAFVILAMLFFRIHLLDKPEAVEMLREAIQRREEEIRR